MNSGRMWGKRQVGRQAPDRSVTALAMRNRRAVAATAGTRTPCFRLAAVVRSVAAHVTPLGPLRALPSCRAARWPLAGRGKPKCQAPAQHNIALRAMRLWRTERLNAGRVTECYVGRPGLRRRLRVNARSFVKACGEGTRPTPHPGVVRSCLRHHRARCWCPRPPSSLRQRVSAAHSLPLPPQGLPFSG